MTTYLLITSDKPTELTVFVGPKEPPIAIRFPDEGTRRKYERECSDYQKAMETAKASRLPVVNFEKLIGHTSSSGSVYIYDRLEELKPGEVVPLPGWELEKVYQKQYEDRWIITSKYNYGLGKTTDYTESFRQAYRLKRSEPVKERPDLEHLKDKYPERVQKIYDRFDDIQRRNKKLGLLEEESPIEAKTQEHWDWSTKSPELKALCWALDKIWAKVSPAEDATTSWGRQESGRAIEAYVNSVMTPESHKTQESQEDLFRELFGRLYDALERGYGTMESIKNEFILTRRNP